MPLPGHTRDSAQVVEQRVVDRVGEPGHLATAADHRPQTLDVLGFRRQRPGSSEHVEGARCASATPQPAVDGQRDDRGNDVFVQIGGEQVVRLGPSSLFETHPSEPRLAIAPIGVIVVIRGVSDRIFEVAGCQLHPPNLAEARPQTPQGVRDIVVRTILDADRSRPLQVVDAAEIVGEDDTSRTFRVQRLGKAVPVAARARCGDRPVGKRRR